LPSIKDVAKEAGVSISTVSNVMSGNRYVSDELAQRVHQAIENLDYEVDLIARSLKNNRTMTIGVVLTSMDRIFIPQVLSGMQHSAQAHKYNLLIYTTRDDKLKEKKYLKHLVNSRVDGIILDSVANIGDERYFNWLAGLSKGKTKIPVVSIERDLSRYSLCSIYVNNEIGAFNATKHLLSCGCKRIIHIAGPKEIEMPEHRAKGYQRALQESGQPLNPDYEVRGDFSPLSGYRQMKRVLDNGIGFDAVFADNDQMAIGAIKALKENGYRIPGQIKVVGFDNTFVSSIVKPALTTINVPKYRMGVESVERLYKLMTGEENGACSFELATKLLIRESTTGESQENWDLEGW